MFYIECDPGIVELQISIDACLFIQFLSIFSHLEKSLLMVPFSYVHDILKSLCGCVKMHYKTELACRIIIFITK